MLRQQSEPLDSMAIEALWAGHENYSPGDEANWTDGDDINWYLPPPPIRTVQTSRGRSELVLMPPSIESEINEAHETHELKFLETSEADKMVIYPVWRARRERMDWEAMSWWEKWIKKLKGVGRAKTEDGVGEKDGRRGGEGGVRVVGWSKKKVMRSRGGYVKLDG
ncbi:hypothetical protein EK21DRAFT_91161 [Setomelanomma holmii]|uniref:Uncharacterized protein n=1 Tax=Setomelanomma holmii TaxID=210430 RepID=A0A9P4H4B0_9PLEO|nr:hypothetical protein EK21DRAFT_91161 [Setomelanomma holmii]